jgi:electron-transferring-flavoprotein dehydrogenase
MSMTMPDREAMDFDVVIVGAGPAGLSAAIKLKQLHPDASIVVVEKGSEVGAHILSGVIVDPIGLDRLLPEWRNDPACPLKVKVTQEDFLILGPSGDLRIPNMLLPPFMHNDGHFIGSLGALARYLAHHAEQLGVDIYPGFAATEVLYSEDGEVVGVATGDMGVDRNHQPTSSFTRGMELRAKYVLLAEGARGSLSKKVIAKYALDIGSQPQKYGLGFKEIWQIDPAKHKLGLVQHSFGWPLDRHTGGGSFLYHIDDHQIAVGFVVHLDYQNPTLSPFDEFQRFKTHPRIAPLFEGATRLAYGARALTEGGWQSVPRIAFPGGALLGCAAGFINVPRIKGSHNAILSGILAAEHVASALKQGRKNDDLAAYNRDWRGSDIGRDLFRVRNVKPLWARLGTWFGIICGGLDMWCNHLLRFSPLGTLPHKGPDHASLKPLSSVTPHVYPKPDGKITFDRLSSVFLSNTAHEENQPCHLVLSNPHLPISHNLPIYGEPARLYCPAGVYEVVYGNEAAHSEPRFVINAQNCIHCKTCDIKDPSQNIHWQPPEGGGGPNYGQM